MGKSGRSDRFYFLVFQNHCGWWLQPWNLKTLAPWKNSYYKPRQHIQKQRHKLSTKVCRVKAVVFLVLMYRCESWTIKKGEHQRTDAFKLWCWKILWRAPWTVRRNKSVSSKRNQPWIFIGRIDAEPEAPIVWPPDVRADLLEKTLMLHSLPTWRPWGLPVSPLLQQVVLITSTRHTSAITIRELCKNKVYY